MDDKESTVMTGIVENFSAGKWGVAGIKLSGYGWLNAPEKSDLLTPDLVGQRVELVLANYYGTGVPFVVELKDARGSVRKLKDNFVASPVSAQVMIAEWFSFYKPLREQLVPKGVKPTDSYVVADKEKQASDVATELFKVYRSEKYIKKGV